MGKRVVTHLCELEGLKFLYFDDDGDYLILHFENDVSVVLCYDHVENGCMYSPEVVKGECLTVDEKYGLGLITTEEFRKIVAEREARRQAFLKEREEERGKKEYSEYLKLKEKYEGGE